MSDLLVSVCVVTYNHERYLAKCLDGILGQVTNFKVEIVVGEDASTDATKSILKSYEQKYPNSIRAIYHSKNVGISANFFDHVFTKMTGKYIAWCDGDDHWTDPYKLQKQVDFLEAHPDCAITFHDVISINQNDAIIKIDHPKDGIQKIPALDIFKTPMPTVSLVFRNVFQSYIPELKLTQSGDAVVKAYLSGFGYAANMGFVGANYRIHQNGVMSMIPRFKQFQRSIECRKKMLQMNIFNNTQKQILKSEISRRKMVYSKILLRKYRLSEAIKIMLT